MVSSESMGMVLMCVNEKFLKMNTKSKFFSENCTRSKLATSTSLSVTTVNGGSVRCTRQFTVGCMNTLERCGTPWKPRSRYGMSNSSSPADASSTLRTNFWNSSFMLRRISASEA